MPTKKKKVLILGMVGDITQNAADTLKASLKEDFPDHTVRIITGLLVAAEFEMEVDSKHNENGYL